MLEFLDSLSGRPNEIVLCLNSDDAHLCARLQAHPCIDRLIVQPENPGFSGGVNACMASTTHPFIWLLNPDVLPAPNYLELSLDVLSRNPRCGAVGGLLLRSEGDEAVIDSAGFAMQPWFRVVDRASGERDVGQFHQIESVLGLCAASLVIRRDAAEEAACPEGCFDVDYWMYKEDQDFCLRLREHGFECFFEPAARCLHTRGWQQGRRQNVPLLLRRHSLKNRYLLMARHLSPVRDLWRFPAIIVFELALLFRLLLLEPRTSVGYGMALALLPKTLRKRWVRRNSRGRDDRANGTG